MASVFLSYDHEDSRRAAPIAAALEKAGHSVWWDRHIHGGAEYNSEIETAVEKADAVVVLWSERSIRSAWVRDEAAEGRDNGKLVPVVIDSVKPPMGFRQFQTIDLTGWAGRGRPPGLHDILNSIRKVAGGRADLQAKHEPLSLPTFPKGSRDLRLAVIAVLVFAAMGAAYWLVDRGPRVSVPVVAVGAADASPMSRSLADDLFIKLGSLQAAKADALQLVEQDSEAKKNLRFRVGERVSEGRIHATVALLSDDNGGLLWSREFQRDQGLEADLRQQVAYSAAEALFCATEAMSPSHDKLELATFKLYLNGCAAISDGSANPRPLIDLFRTVVQQAPDFERGWAKLLLAETSAFLESELNDPALRKSIQADIKQARHLNPSMAEAYIAEAWMQPLRPISGFMRLSEEAVRRNPDHAYALVHHSEDMYHVGRVQQAIADVRLAVRSNPLSPDLRGALINGLANAGEIQAAMSALEEADRLWPGTSNLIGIRFELMLRYGDPREALEMLRSGAVSRQWLSPAIESFLDARIDPTPTKVAKALEEARAVSTRWPANYFQTLAEFGRKDELIKALSERNPEEFVPLAVLFRPDFRILHHDTRFIAIANRWGLVEYWRTSGKWPDFCFEPNLPYDCQKEAAKLLRNR